MIKKIEERNRSVKIYLEKTTIVRVGVGKMLGVDDQEMPLYMPIYDAMEVSISAYGSIDGPLYDRSKDAYDVYNLGDFDMDVKYYVSVADAYGIEYVFEGVHEIEIDGVSDKMIQEILKKLETEIREKVM